MFQTEGLRARLGRLAVSILAICIASSPAVAAEADKALEEFKKATVGDWSQIAALPLANFSVDAAKLAEKACTEENAALLRFRLQSQALLKAKGPAPVEAVLSVRQGDQRDGFTPWLVLTNEGASGMLLGMASVGGTKKRILMTDDATYLQCARKTPAKKASEEKAVKER